MPMRALMALRSSTAARESKPASIRGWLAATGMPITSAARPAIAGCCHMFESFSSSILRMPGVELMKGSGCVVWSLLISISC